MVFKFSTILILVVASNTSAYIASLPLMLAEEPTQVKSVEEHNSYPQYTYTYGVTDLISGDTKSQTETRHGDVVHGEYSLNDADGYKRTVKYTADDVSGFNAVVDRRPIAEPKLVAAAPIVLKPISPSAYHVKPAPIVYTAPTVIKSIPATYVTRSVFKPALSYTTGLVYRSVPHIYASPRIVKRVPVTYSLPSTYTY